MTPDLQSRIDEFVGKYLPAAKPGEKVEISESAYGRLKILLEDARYSRIEDGKNPESGKFIRERAVYARTHEDQSIDIFVEYNVAALASGFSYLRVANLVELDRFRKDLNEVVNIDPSGDIVAGSMFGAVLGMLGFLSYNLIADSMSMVPLVLVPIFGGVGFVTGYAVSQEEYTKTRNKYKTAHAHAISGRDAIIQALQMNSGVVDHILDDPSDE